MTPIAPILFAATIGFIGGLALGLWILLRFIAVAQWRIEQERSRIIELNRDIADLRAQLTIARGLDALRRYRKERQSRASGEEWRVE